MKHISLLSFLTLSLLPITTFTKESGEMYQLAQQVITDKNEATTMLYYNIFRSQVRTILSDENLSDDEKCKIIEEKIHMFIDMVQSYTTTLFDKMKNKTSSLLSYKSLTADDILSVLDDFDDYVALLVLAYGTGESVGKKIEAIASKIIKESRNN